MSGQDAVPFEDVLAEAGWLRRLARELTCDPGSADDLVQETWLTALENPPDRRGSLRAWLARVAKSRLIDRRRAEKRATDRARAVAESRTAPAAAETVARAEILRRVMAAVLDLPEPFRTTVLLRYSDGLSPARIARETGVAAATVRTRLHRGRERLREALGVDGARRGRSGGLLPLVTLAKVPKPAEAAIMAAKTKLSLSLAAAVLLALGGLAWLTLPGGGPSGPGSAPAPAAGPPALVATGTAEASPAPPGAVAPGPEAETAIESGARRGGPVDPDLARLSVWMTLAETGVVLEEDDYRDVNRFLEAMAAALPFPIDAPPGLGPLGHEKSEFPFTPGGPPGREFEVLSALKSLSVFRNLIFEIRPGGVRVRRGKLLPIDGAAGGKVFWQEASGSWWREPLDRMILAGRRAVTAEARLRERFQGLEEFAGLDLTIPERTRIEDLDDLRWAIVRASGRELPVLLPRALEDEPVAGIRRRGTAAEILDAGLGAGRGLRAVATRYGIEVLPPAVADRAVAERRALVEVRARLGAGRLDGIPDHLSLRELGAAIAAATGVRVFVDGEWAGYQVACEPGRTAAELFDGIRDTFPYVGWTVVGDSVFVSRELPAEDR